MATIFHDDDADLEVLAGSSVAVVGYGNQGRSWALNLRDSGFDVSVCVRADASRDQAVADGFEGRELAGAPPACGRFDPAGDVGMVAPRMLGPEVRRCYEEGIGFITAVGVHRDATGR